MYMRHKHTRDIMLSTSHLSRIDLRALGLAFALLTLSLFAISSYTTDGSIEALEGSFFTPAVVRQIKNIALGSLLFFFFAAFDYRKLREWTWVLYFLMLMSLVGVFFTDSIQRVHRWYRIPLIGMNFQPSEYAKLIVVIALSWFLEKRESSSHSWGTAFFAGIIAFIPFLLILKQPDLGTALILYPITLVLFYFGDIRKSVVKAMSILGAFALIAVAMMFLGVVSHDEMRPFATKFIKEYQYDRLSPNTHHQQAASTAIAIGGVAGKGWRKSEFTGGGWLPEPYTDSIFPAFAEEFGFLGQLLVLALYYALLYFCFQVALVAADPFGRLLAAGVTIYLTMHILVNIGMMCGLLPITGVPLSLFSYGGSSILSTMTALGILQSIYSRRFMF